MRTLLFLLLLGTRLAPAVTLYVSPSGDDSGTCQSNRPCRTIARAASLTVAGDIVEIAPGQYSERNYITRSGTAAAPITYRGHNGNGCASIPLSDINSRGFRPAPTVTNWGFYLRADYIVVECMRVIGTPSDFVYEAGDNRSGFYIHTARHDIVITDSAIDGGNRLGAMHAGIGFGPLANALPYKVRASRNYITRTGYGLLVYCATGCLFEDNEVEDLQAPWANIDLDYSRLFGRDITMRRNYFHGNSTLNCQGCHIDCFQTWNLNQYANEIAQNIVIDGNTCFNAHQGIILRDQTSLTPGVYATHFNWTVTNNVFAYGPAPSTMAWCALFEHAGNINFRHNLCYGSGQVGYLDGTTGIHEYNLHLSQANPYNANAISPNWTAGSISARNNLIYTRDRTFSPSSYPNDLVNIDPVLASPIASDFRLTSGSPAVDRAVGSLVTADKNGAPRPQGSAPDIGPYELPFARYYNFGVQAGHYKSSPSAPGSGFLLWTFDENGDPNPDEAVQVLPNACTLSSATILAQDTASFRLVVERLADATAEEPEWQLISGDFGLAGMQSYGNTALSGWSTAIPAGSSLRVRVDGTPEALAPAQVFLRCN